jgi:hypothetical protein
MQDRLPKMCGIKNYKNNRLIKYDRNWSFDSKHAKFCLLLYCYTFGYPVLTGHVATSNAIVGKKSELRLKRGGKCF